MLLSFSEPGGSESRALTAPGMKLLQCVAVTVVMPSLCCLCDE